MKKSITAGILTALLASSVGVHSSSATSLDSTDASVLAKEYKEVMEIVKENMINGSELNVDSLPEVQDFKEKYSEEQIKSLSEESISENYDEFANKMNSGEFILPANGQKIIEFEDGSFVEIQATTVEKNSDTDPSKPMFSPLAVIDSEQYTYNATAGNTNTTTYSVAWWGIYKVMEAYIVTDWKTSTTAVDIIDVDNVGTWAVPPVSFTAIPKIVTDNAANVESRVSYSKFSGIADFGLGFTHTFNLRTQIKKISYVGNKVILQITNTVEE